MLLDAKYGLFESLPRSLVAELLARDSLVRPEIEFFGALLRWGSYQLAHAHAGEETEEEKKKVYPLVAHSNQQ